MDNRQFYAYKEILKELHEHCKKLHYKHYTIADMLRLRLTISQRFTEAGPEIFAFLPPLPDEAVLQFVRWIAYGGECLVAKASNSKTREKYAVRIAWATFNEPDIQPKRGEVLRNEWRLRFIRGMELQRMLAAEIEQEHDLGRIQNIVNFTRQAPVISIHPWIAGENLWNFRYQYQEDFPRLAFVFWRFCNLLWEVHKKKVVHRDLSPKNIIVDNYDCPYLSDFTVTKDLGVQDGLTVGETRLGNNLYAAPEQIYSGNSHLATYKSDIFSLAWIMYFLLTGHDPPKEPMVRRLREREKHNCPEDFRKLFYQGTQETINTRPDIEDFIRQYTLACRACGVHFEEILVARGMQLQESQGNGGGTTTLERPKGFELKRLELRLDDFESRLILIESKLTELCKIFSKGIKK